MLLSVGDHDRTSQTETKWAASHELANYLNHPDYNEDKSYNDIALVKTKFYVRFTLVLYN